MSDFDKEAEREKLREKFAKDDQKRERTSRMSELLLKGATMTNKHHDCGSPIFRWQGEEFCPTCQGTPDGEGVAEVEADEGEQTADATTVDVESPAESPDQPTPETANGTPEVADQSPIRSPEPSPDPTPTPDARAQSPAPTPDARAQSPAPTPDARAQSPAPTHSQSTTGTKQSGDLATARASLTRTLTSLAQRAESTDDVSKQRDLLAAVEDAAAALEATKHADR
jgi:uncharacterized Zn finger protein (UPF0148 family)